MIICGTNMQSPTRTFEIKQSMHWQPDMAMQEQMSGNTQWYGVRMQDQWDQATTRN
jgi:hypothetical protein